MFYSHRNLIRLPPPNPLHPTPNSQRPSDTKSEPEKPSSSLPNNWWFPPPQEVRTLPGELDTVPVFYSNSPEIIRRSGILLSTFSPKGKRDPSAHLNFPFEGRFNVFTHHVAKAYQPDNTPTLYQGLMLYNPSKSRTIAVNVLQAGSFLGTPDAPSLICPPYSTMISVVCFLVLAVESWI